MNIKKKGHFKVVGFWMPKLAISSISLISLLCLCPIASEANATESNQLLAPASVQVNPMIAIGLDQEAFDMEVTPKSSGTAAVETAKLTVSTNNTSGYKIYMHTADGSGNLKNLSQNANITPVADNSKLSDFAENTWGYYIDAAAVNDESTFHPVGTSANTAIKDVPTAHAAAASYNLAIATKVGTSLPAGTYSNVLVISAIANPIEITSMDQLFFMQDITPELCANATMEQQRQLTDTRDGKTYWVAKLKDGNCWMTQNLALDIPAEGLSATDTDIEEDWDENSTYPPAATKNVIENVDGGAEKASKDILSWNLGDWVVGIPNYSKRCSSTKDISTCESVGYVDVSGADWRSGFDATDGVFSLPDGTNVNGYVAVRQSDKTYDAHYLLGNYYNYAAAVAGTWAAKIPGVATGSICPKGWKMPYQRTKADGYEGDFYRLALYYGLEAKLSSVSSEENMDYWTDGIVYKADRFPLYLGLGGNIPAQIYDNVIEDGKYRRIFVSSLTLYYESYARTWLESVVFGAEPGGGVVAAVANPTFYGNNVRCLVRTN